MNNKELAQQTATKFVIAPLREVYLQLLDGMSEFDLVAFKGYHILDKEKAFIEFFTEERISEMNKITESLNKNSADVSSHFNSLNLTDELGMSSFKIESIFTEIMRIILFEGEQASIEKLRHAFIQELPDFEKDVYRLALIKNEESLLPYQNDLVFLKKEFHDPSFLDSLVKVSLQNNPAHQRMINQGIMSKEELANFLQVMSLESIESLQQKTS